MLKPHYCLQCILALDCHLDPKRQTVFEHFCDYFATTSELVVLCEETSHSFIVESIAFMEKNGFLTTCDIGGSQIAIKPIYEIEEDDIYFCRGERFHA